MDVVGPGFSRGGGIGRGSGSQESGAAVGIFKRGKTEGQGMSQVHRNPSKCYTIWTKVLGHLIITPTGTPTSPLQL